MQDAGRSTTAGAEQQTRYTLALRQLRRLVAQREAAAAAAAVKLAPEQACLAAAVAAVDTQRSAFRRLVSDVAEAANRAAAAGAGGAAVPERALQRFQAEEPAKAARVRELRAAQARLAHRLAAAERCLREADQLRSEGLHLVDFEQARIETVALTAKREAREAEVAKLRSKLVQTVQVGGGGGIEAGGSGAVTRTRAWKCSAEPASITKSLSAVVAMCGRQPGVCRAGLLGRHQPQAAGTRASAAGHARPSPLLAARLACRSPPM